MHLNELRLTNYRNYKKMELSFENKINVFLGENAQGKTNVMEAIYVLAMANSHRTSRDKELIKWDEEYAKIEGRIEKKTGSLSLQLVISQQGKKAKVNHLEQKKLSEYIGALNVVMFAPEDLNLVKGSPGVRRRFIDMEIGQVQPVYLYHLGQYIKLLQQRNSLLKNMRNSSQEKMIMMEILTDQLVEQAANVIIRRFRFIELLQEWAEPIHRGISRNLEELKIQYNPSAEVSETMDLSKIVEAYKQKFDKIKDREIERGVTLAGPHRDDLSFFVNGKDVQTFGSQGQQRTTALSLKLAEIELIKGEVGEYPLLLLDDVLSELDDFRQSHLLNTIQGRVQTFVTTTSVEGIHHSTLDKASMFEVKQGEIFQTK
ncbi:DNA replication/repair protein RecF [Pseudalkalibacillus caeni]|uniref:DNA replication and repair protein RecF n=1 Tax=Exobacillus caeni TaxID=2574798 RepID=A0A5R9F3T5_9BACL|nr:DNA replication/repair protein RecF [Pseudalkalibacillus caeni]TLS35124.1 DNA replication/repair protein RecF [Pseudalkalibacillus caeni]